MGNATHEQVNLMLKLYDLRREPKLREARDWYFQNFNIKSAEDVMKIAPFGSKENAYMRMVMSYWDMVAGIANRGLVDEELFFESTGEQWGVWERSSRRSGRFGRCSAIRNFSRTSRSTASAWKRGEKRMRPERTRRCVSFRSRSSSR